MSASSPLAQRIAGFPVTVFSEFSALARASNAVNLGQGFPDFDGPDEVKEVALRAIRDGVNQYAISSGSEKLREAIAAHSARFYGQKIDPDTMISVTSGATEALFDAILGLVNPGDEVVLFEPFYDSYAASVTLAGGVCRYVLLRPPDASHATWWFDAEELRAACGPKTRLVVVNTPHNPTGKVFTRDELALIGALCAQTGAFVLSDEVYEHLVFEPAQFVRTSTVPGLFDRTITVSSGGKTFSFTGWKIGWAIAPASLRQAVQRTHQFVTFATASPFQEAIAHALGMPDGFYASLALAYRARRDRLVRAVEAAGLRCFPTEGTYFLIADITPTGFSDDFAFCRHLTTEAGVAAIPTSAFYSPEHAPHGRRFARLAFCKTDAVLDEGARRLLRWSQTRR